MFILCTSFSICMCVCKLLCNLYFISIFTSLLSFRRFRFDFMKMLQCVFIITIDWYAWYHATKFILRESQVVTGYEWWWWWVQNRHVLLICVHFSAANFFSLVDPNGMGMLEALGLLWESRLRSAMSADRRSPCSWIMASSFSTSLPSQLCTLKPNVYIPNSHTYEHITSLVYIDFRVNTGSLALCIIRGSILFCLDSEILPSLSSFWKWTEF